MDRCRRVSATTGSRSCSGSDVVGAALAATSVPEKAFAAKAAPTKESTMSDILQLACDLISRASVTPDDAGCQKLVADRLQRAGFRCESLRFGEVDNLWAMHGEGGP